MAKGVQFSDKSAKRIAEAVRQVERMPTDLSGTPRRGPRGSSGDPTTATIHHTCLTKQNGTDGGSPDQPTYDLYSSDDLGLTTPINLAGPLSPENSPARTTIPELLATAPADGSSAAAYFDETNVIHLWSLPEKNCAAAGTPA